MNKKVFLTGAAGFAGKPIAEYLHQRKFKVTKILFSHFKKKGIKIDLTKKILLKRDFDWIVHTASHHKIKDFKSKPKLKEKNNILMVKNLIQFSKKNKIKTIGFSGFNGGYLKKNADISVHIRADNYGISEDAHHILMHGLLQYLIKYFGKKKN